jgi:formate--tetrahydrofolate ligase
MSSYKSDIDIANEAKLQHISEIAKQIGLTPEDLVYYGDYKAKIKMSTIQKIFANNKNKGKLILVTAITPTSAGEGKTTTSIGLTQALRQIGKKTIVALREPSLGPVFGVKGGAAGGGYSQVLPMEDINLHFTGDMHAITSANNLISAAIDNYLYRSNEKNVNLDHILWKRVMDMNDRSLRQIVVGLGTKNGLPRETGFDITAASEIMAILCLSMNYSELKERIGKILLGFTRNREPFYVKDLKVEGAVASLLKEALMPNLVQTLENGPAFVHGGPFANIAQGANTIIATNLAIALSDYAVTEAGFGADLGAEKFFNIVSPYGKFRPSAVVLVATARALKRHGGVKKKELNNSNPDAVLKGSENLEKHIENVRKFGVEPVVCINRFPTDTEDELKTIGKICEKHNVEYAVSTQWADGGKGAVELAEKVIKVADSHKEPEQKTLYDWEDKVEDKIEKIAKEIYGAKDVEFTSEAKYVLKLIYKYNYDKLPICMAKTQSSLSDNAKLVGRPRDFTLTVREIIISSGAGFLVPLTGDVLRMPGLPKTPAAQTIDIDDEGNISGLF